LQQERDTAFLDRRRVEEGRGNERDRDETNDKQNLTGLNETNDKPSKGASPTPPPLPRQSFRRRRSLAAASLADLIR
jgi:hypothetical protein